MRFPPALVDHLAVYYAGEVGKRLGTFTDAGGSSGSDAVEIDKLTAHLTPSRRTEILAEAEARAVEIVTGNLPLVGHLAHATACVGTLDQEQVDEILAQHGL